VLQAKDERFSDISLRENHGQCVLPDTWTVLEKSLGQARTKRVTTSTSKETILEKMEAKNDATNEAHSAATVGDEEMDKTKLLF
jgi:hypothetical protein